ncbi:MAG TPA: RNA methyltransferase [Terracidiphilus sp.]|nr:RNA methyltransferase [Terracidiphilus sp.]
MLTESQRDRIEVVLVSPRNPLNIGAVARAMANFGFARLTVVAPYAPNWREARSAVGAPGLLQFAVEAGSLAEAVANCTLVLGTGTLTHRKPEQRVVTLPAIASIVEPEAARDGHVALVFGPEKHGLTRDDLSYCHVLVEIPTDPGQPSMNLGQAAAVCFYELASRPHAVALDSPPESAPSDATSGALDALANLIEQTMNSANYSPGAMQDANRHDLRLMLRRLNLRPADLRRALGFFRRVLWHLNSHEENNPLPR